MKKIIDIFIKILFYILILIEPFLEMVCLNKYEIIGLQLNTFIRLILFGTLSMLLLTKFKTLKSKKYFIIYLILIGIYFIFHHINASDFKSYHITNFDYSIIEEMFYVIRMLIPIFLMYYIYNFDFKEKDLKNIIIPFVLFLTTITIISNIFKFSYASYLCSTGHCKIAGNIFDWFINPGKYNYLQLASKGLFHHVIFYYLIILFFPIIIYFFTKNNNKKIDILYYVMIFCTYICMFMVGTKASTYGFIIILVTSLLVYLYFIFIKKEIKPQKEKIIYLVIIIMLSILLIPNSPMLNRNNLDQDIANNKIENEEQNNQLINNIDYSIVEKYLTEDEKKLIDKNIKTINVNDLIEIIEDEEREKSMLIEVIRTNLYDYGFEIAFIESQYPYSMDPYFWKTYADETEHYERSKTRNVIKRIYDRVYEVNDNKNDKFLGVTYSRLSKIFNLERDFMYQTYTMGIIGSSLLVGPYVLIILIVGLVMLIKYKEKFTYKNCSILLGIGLFNFLAFYSGNTLDNLGVTIPLGIIYGFLIKCLLNKSDNTKVEQEKKEDVENMIPKKIHYVWVGGKKKPKDIRKCMKTWKKYLKDYEIIEWNENNFDINSNQFTKQAYENKKWAFVSDYIRAYAIYNEGGIYLDTDNCVLRNLDDLLSNRAFVGYENPEYPFTACFGAEKNHPLVKDMLDYYNDINFEFDKDNQLDKVNTKSVSELLIKKYKCKKGNKEQLLKEDIKVYKDNVLCNPSKNSYVIHVFTGTWMEGKKPLKRLLSKFLKVRINTPTKAELYHKYIGKE